MYTIYCLFYEISEIRLLNQVFEYILNLLKLKNQQLLKNKFLFIYFLHAFINL